MKKVIILSCTLLFSVAIQAQLGGLKKVASKKNVDAAKKTVDAVTLSEDDVKMYSLEGVKWMDENNPVADPATDEMAKRLENLVKNHLNEDGLELNFKLYNVVDVNAFATADGSVRVCRGLMEVMNDQEVLAVIGHEIGHVKNKHSLNQMRQALLTSAGKDALAANTGAGAALNDAEIGDFVERFAGAQFSQGDESESDEYSFAFMVKHGYDYHAVESAFRKLAELIGSGKGNIMSSHPGLDKRAKRAAKWAKKQDKK